MSESKLYKEIEKKGYTIENDHGFDFEVVDRKDAFNILDEAKREFPMQKEFTKQILNAIKECDKKRETKKQKCNHYRKEDNWCKGKDAICDGWCSC